MGLGTRLCSLLILIFSEAQLLMGSVTSIIDLGDKVVAHNRGMHTKKSSSISVSIARSGLFQFQ